MTTLDIIKSKIQKLYQTNPQIHINAVVVRPRVCLKNEPVEIKGIYPHIFQIEERSDGIPRRHSIQYVDVLTKQIEIVELGSGEF